MKRGIHLVLGGVAFFLFIWAAGKVVPASAMPLLPGIIAALIGSLAPDCLEPPTSWHHRNICHSWRAVFFTGILVPLTIGGLILECRNETLPDFPILWTICCFSLGYCIHLLADSCTKMGLPK